MLFQQIVTNIDERQYANAEQLFGQPTTDFFGMQYVPGEREMATVTAHREDPEDAILVAFLPQLVARAKMESPSPDWEQEIIE